MNPESSPLGANPAGSNLNCGGTWFSNAIKLIFVVHLFGCSVHQVNLPGADSGFVESDASQAAEFNAALKSSANEIRTFRGLVSIKARKAVGREEFNQVLVFSRPDKLRIETFAPGVNQLLTLVVVNGDKIQALDRKNLTGLQGEVNTYNVEKLIEIPLLPEEFMLWILGRFLPQDEATLFSSSISRKPTSNTYSARYDLRDGRSFRILVDWDGKAAPRVIGFELYTIDEKAPVLVSRFNYSEPEMTGSFAYPARVEVELKKRSLYVELSLQNPRINPILEDKTGRLFRVSFPQNYEIQALP